MRATVYYIFLNFLLLSGGNYLYADTHHSTTHFSFSQNQEIKQQVKHKNTRHHGVFKESADIEVDEEFHTNDSHNGNGANKFLAEKQSLYLTHSRQIIFKDYSNNFRISTPFSIYSNPIYLRMGVFRI